MKLKKLIALLLVVTMAMSVFAGCGAEKEETLEFQFISLMTGGAAWSRAEQGFNDACKELGIEGQYVSPVERNNLVEMATLLDQAVTNEVDAAIGVFASAELFGPALLKAQEQGVVTASVQLNLDEQYVDFNMGKSAANPKKNIPLAFCLSALVGAVIYGVIGFSATHTHSFSVIAGMNLGGIAEMIMPNTMYLFFVIGGALFALCTSLVGAIVSGYRPLIACTKDGWLPTGLMKTTKGGTPYVMFLLYLLGAVPILLGMDLGDVATICLFPGAILKVMINIGAMSIPTRFAKEWKESGMTISLGLYKTLLVISSLASITLGVFYFNSNDLKVAMIAVTAVIALYGILVGKFGKVTLHVKEEYMENAAK